MEKKCREEVRHTEIRLETDASVLRNTASELEREKHRLNGELEALRGAHSSTLSDLLKTQEEA